MGIKLNKKPFVVSVWGGRGIGLVGEIRFHFLADALRCAEMHRARNPRHASVREEYLDIRHCLSSGMCWVVGILTRDYGHLLK